MITLLSGAGVGTGAAVQLKNGAPVLAQLSVSGTGFSGAVSVEFSTDGGTTWIQAISASDDSACSSTSAYSKMVLIPAYAKARGVVAAGGTPSITVRLQLT